MCVIYTIQNYLNIINLTSYVKITHQYTSFCCIHHIILLLLQIQHTRELHYIIICCVAKCKLTETFHIIVLALIQTFFKFSCFSLSNLFRCLIRIVFEYLHTIVHRIVVLVAPNPVTALQYAINNVSDMNMEK